MNKIALWGLCAFAFTVPLENTITIDGVGTVARIVGYVAFGLCLWCVFLRGHVHRPDMVHALWSAFVLLVIFSLTWTVDMEMTLLHVVIYVQLLAMMWVIGEIASSGADQQKLLTWLVIGATVSAVATLYAYRAGTTVNNSAYRYATEGFDPNDLALTFALAIPSAWYLRSISRSLRERGVFFLSVPLLVIGILLTGSRGGVLSGAAALLIIPALAKRRNIGATALLIVGAAISVAAIVPAQNSGPDLHDSRAHPDGHDDQSNGNLVRWAETLPSASSLWSWRGGVPYGGAVRGSRHRNGRPQHLPISTHRTWPRWLHYSGRYSIFHLSANPLHADNAKAPMGDFALDVVHRCSWSNVGAQKDDVAPVRVDRRPSTRIWKSTAGRP